MTSQPEAGRQIIALHILRNISKNKRNLAKKFGQSIERKKRNIFLQKLYAKCAGENVPRTFFRKWKLSILLDQLSKVLFIVCQVKGYRNMWKLNCRPLAFTFYKAFLKEKRRSGTSLPVSFSALFLKKNISLVICY